MNTPCKPGKKRRFLALLEASGNIHAAAKKCHISTRTVYKLRKRSPAFAAAMDEAREVGTLALTGELENELVNRALAGPADRGSALLLIFALKKLDPRYRDNHQASPPQALDYWIDLSEPDQDQEPEPDGRYSLPGPASDTGQN